MFNTLEKSRAKLKEYAEQAPRGTRWRHLKSGHDYMVQGHVLIEANLMPAVVYSRYGQTENWCRPASEFLDGRFENVTEL